MSIEVEMPRWERALPYVIIVEGNRRILEGQGGVLFGLWLRQPSQYSMTRCALEKNLMKKEKQKKDGRSV